MIKMIFDNDVEITVNRLAFDRLGGSIDSYFMRNGKAFFFGEEKKCYDGNNWIFAKEEECYGDGFWECKKIEILR